MPGISRHLRFGLSAKVLLAVTVAVLVAAGAAGCLCFIAGGSAKPQAGMIGLSAAIAILAATTGYMSLWRIIIRPLRNLETAVRHAATGSFGGPTGTGRQDEIGRVAEVVEKMSGALAASADELLLAKSQAEQETARSIGELELLNRRLREEIAEKEYFLLAVSHDLNAPLRNISGMAAMALRKDGPELPPELAARLKRIQTNADVAGEMISELLELSRIKSLPQKRQVVDMKELISEQARVFEFELNSRNIVLEVKAPMPVLYVDKALIRKSFQNLVDNAIKYMDKSAGGRIEVGWERAEEFHRFCVADNGPGIPPSEQESIFRPFCRAPSALAGKIEGKGVGLATVATVAAEYGGKAWAESDPGRGARFYITFSVAGTAPPGQVAAAQASRAAPELGKPNVRLAGPVGPSGRWKTT